MDKSRTDDWRSLCELASKENDPQKLLDLITKINNALQEYGRHSNTKEAPLKVDTVLLPTSRSQNDLDFYRFPGEYFATVEYDC